MRVNLFVIFMFIGQLLSAQIFVEDTSPLLPKTPFKDLDQSSIAFADVDGDGDEDALLGGLGTNPILYLNDNGNFSEVENTPFEGGNSGSITFADVNGDDKKDVLITGRNLTGTRVAKLYLNDSQGNFTEVANTPFEGVNLSSVAFADIDKDGDQDVLITGRNPESNASSKLYTNDGTGTFTLVNGTPFDEVYDGSIAFSDVDKDGAPDLLLTGGKPVDGTLTTVTKLYTNDGSGTFSEVAGTPFEEVNNSAVAFADVDGDEDEDVIIVGEIRSLNYSAKLYINDGAGNFAETPNTPFKGVEDGDVAFADIDGDNDQDIIIIGAELVSGDDGLSINVFANLYTNDGSGNFTEDTFTPFQGVFNGAVAFSDVEGDGDQDVLITGNFPEGGSTNASAQIPTTKLYYNSGFGGFADAAADTAFMNIDQAALAFEDIDGDNDQDLLMMTRGMLPTLFTNDGMGKFCEVSGTSFEPSGYFGAIAFADVDGDDDKDVLISGGELVPIPNRPGFVEQVNSTFLYINDGDGNFTKSLTSTFEPVSNCAVAFADINNDGDQDVIIAGEDTLENATAILYTNDGDGNFTREENTPFTGVRGAALAFSDVDQDGDQDVLITGDKSPPLSTGEFTAILYKNDGTGTFTEETGTPFDGVIGENGSLDFADVDGDGDEDVLISGFNFLSNDGGSVILYINDGQGTFSKQAENPFIQSIGAVAFSDMDNDGDQDVLLTGSTLGGGFWTSTIYKNNGAGIFSEAETQPFIGLRRTAFAFADIDGDSDEDLLITGSQEDDYGDFPYTKLYLNESPPTSINNKFQSFNFTLYPNPTNTGSINIDYTAEKSGRLNINVFDLSGRQLGYQQKQIVAGEQQISLDVSSLARGTYFILLDDGLRRGAKKFVKE